jgi:hypothetical protein
VSTPEFASYADQVIRRERYELAHPNVEINYVSPSWVGTVPGYPRPFVRYDLRRLLDILEALDEPAG